MYLKNIGIENIGPIESLSVELPFTKKGDPKPIVFVGENGSGKTILQSQIMDSFYEIASSLFDDIGVQDGSNRSYYKISGSTNLQTGKDKGFSILKFNDNEDQVLEYFDKVGDVKKEDFTEYIEDFALSPYSTETNQKGITEINDNRKEKLQREWIQGVHFYQPAYRYEEPFWKNEPFIDHTRFEDHRKFSGRLDKELEIISSTKENKYFLMDLVLDFTIYRENMIDQTTWLNINNILRQIKKRNDIRFGIGRRGGYRISIVEDQGQDPPKPILPSIDNLSLGELTLLNLFINIIRHGDNPPKSNDQIQGIVVIDEIDVHLHTDLQNSVLPGLIKLFPKVQFIITTHSPFFLLGMKKTFGEEGFEVINMPGGERITTERFSEFENAYNVLKDTEKFENEVKEQIEKSTKPILFVEGVTDTKYIKKAGELLKKSEVLEKIEICDVGGSGNLDIIWKIPNIIKNLTETKTDTRKIILLYDCDTHRYDSDTEKVFKRVIPELENNIIEKGIENLFEQEFINKAEENNLECFEYHVVGTKKTNFKILDGKKQAICDWICENGTKDDFKNFEKIFEIIEQIIMPIRETDKT
jgi:hypothetical protein